MDILFCKAPSFLHVGWLPALWRDSSKVNAAVELASSRRLWSPSLILPGQVGKHISYLPSMYLPERPNNSSVILAWKGSFEFYFKLNKRLRNHESGDNIEQLQRQIPRQVPSKHRIWKRGKHSQSVGFCFVDILIFQASGTIGDYLTGTITLVFGIFFLFLLLSLLTIILTTYARYKVGCIDVGKSLL